MFYGQNTRLLVDAVTFPETLTTPYNSTTPVTFSASQLKRLYWHQINYFSLDGHKLGSLSQGESSTPWNFDVDMKPTEETKRRFTAESLSRMKNEIKDNTQDIDRSKGKPAITSFSIEVIISSNFLLAILYWQYFQYLWRWLIILCEMLYGQNIVSLVDCLLDSP